MTPNLRSAGPDDLAAVAALSGQAFSVSPSPFDPASRPYLIADERRVVAEVDGRVVAHAGAWSFGQWFGGGRLACAGVAGVAVAPEHRGSRIGSAVLTRLLQLAREGGDVIASLYPMNHHFYRAHGFELSSVRRRDRIPTQALRGLLPPGGGRADGLTVRPVQPGDVDGIEQLMPRRARGANGLLDHDRRWANRYAGQYPPAGYAWVAVDRDAEVRGYLQIEHTTATQPEESFSLSVEELVADDVAVQARLWRLVGSDHPGARSAQAHLPPGCLPRLMVEPVITPVSGITQMSRVLDVEKALLCRGWPAGASGEISFEITDPMFPDNAGPLILAVADGVPDVDRSPPGPGRTTLATSIGTLTSLLTGYLDPAIAASSGLLPGVTDAEVGTLRGLLAGPAPETVEYF